MQSLELIVQKKLVLLATNTSQQIKALQFNLKRDIFALKEEVFPPKSYIIAGSKNMLVNIDWQKCELK